jgi:hypothetical protein
MNEKSKIVSLLQQTARFAFVSVQAVVLKSVLSQILCQSVDVM